MDLEGLAPAPTPATRAAREVARAFLSPALLDHSERAYLWAAAHARAIGLDFDAELLLVAALVHDIGLVDTFDSHAVPFELAGGNVGWVFAAGAGWDAARRDRVRDIVVVHMHETPRPADDPEGYLLNVSTSFDISGQRPELWPDELRRPVLDRYPRGDLAEEFARAFEAQAARKPDSAAARSTASGVRKRLASNPLEKSR